LKQETRKPGERRGSASWFPGFLLLLSFDVRHRSGEIHDRAGKAFIGSRAELRTIRAEIFPWAIRELRRPFAFARRPLRSNQMSKHGGISFCHVRMLFDRG
jgi:hypothetical protein